MVSNHMKSFVFYAFLLVFFSAVSPAVSASVDSSVHFQKGNLSVKFVNVPIRAALADIAASTGISVYFDPEIKATISSRFKNLPLDVALRRLLRNQSHALVFSKNPKEYRSLESVKVFREGRQSAARYEVLGGGVVASVRTLYGETTVKPGETGGGSAEKFGVLAAEGQKVAVADGKSSANLAAIKGINPNSLAARSQIMAAIVGVQRDMDYLQRKSAGEERALRRKMAEVQRELAAGSADFVGGGDGSKPDPRKVLGELRTYGGQLERSKQSNALRMIEEQKKMQALTGKLADLSNPAEQARRQAALQQQRAGAQRTQAAIKARAERRAKRL